MYLGIEYRVNARIELTQLGRLFKQEPWTFGRSANDMAKMLEHTALHISAWDGPRLVGFARAVTDTVYRALIDDVIVDAGYQRQGIGTELMKRIACELRDVEEVFLGCGDPVVPFYERLGYVRMHNPHMEWKRE
jgi:GNAT superfamily N-acetyltransferase